MCIRDSFNTAEEMNKVLKYKASGRILEILENLWKLDCEREEKRSRDRWRKKETWQLHYVRKYGNNIVKKKKNQQTQKINAWNKAEKIQKAPNRKIYGFETVKQTTRNSKVRNK